MSWVRKLTDHIRGTEKPADGQTVQKSGTEDGAARPEVDMTAIATEVAEKLAKGEIDADQEVLKSFAAGKGLSDEDATTFAMEVLDAYFGTDSAPTAAVAKSEGATPGATVTPPVEDMHKVLKGLAAKLDAIGFAMLKVFESNEVGHQEIGVLKAAIEKYLDAPVGQKAPVTSVAAGTQMSGTDRSQTKQLILKGMIAGQLQREDMAVFELHGILTDRAQGYVQSQK